MKKISLISLIILYLLFSIGCDMQTRQKKDLKSTLVSAIEKKRGHDEQVIVKLQSLTTFQWDKFYVFTPYTSIENIYNILGFQWRGAIKSGINHRDDINLLVFVKDKKIVEYLEYPRSHGDFYKIKKANGFNAEEAIFEVREENLGEPWLVLYELGALEKK